MIKFNMKKSIMILFCIIFLSSLVLAQTYKMEISQININGIYEAGEKLNIKVTIYDESNVLVNDQVLIIIEDSEKTTKVEKTIQSNTEIAEIDLGTKAMNGQGTITARYKDNEVVETFEISKNEEAEFKLEEGKLTITNNGNTRYIKKIRIQIGETIGEEKTLTLEMGQHKEYKLVAPQGVYNIKVTSDGKTVLTNEAVQLTGTGQVIGALDESVSKRSGITGGIVPNEDSEDSILGYMKNSKFTYVFILVVFGTTILLAVERRYRRKAQ